MKNQERRIPILFCNFTHPEFNRGQEAKSMDYVEWLSWITTLKKLSKINCSSAKSITWGLKSYLSLFLSLFLWTKKLKVTFLNLPLPFSFQDVVEIKVSNHLWAFQDHSTQLSLINSERAVKKWKLHWSWSRKCDFVSSPAYLTLNKSHLQWA